MLRRSLPMPVVLAALGLAGLALPGCKGRFKPIPASRFTEQVSLSGEIGCARMKDASVRCFGAGGVAEAKGLEKSVQIVATGSGVCGRAEDNTVRCMTDGAPAEVVQTPNDVFEIAAGGGTACAVRKMDGVVECWNVHNTHDGPGRFTRGVERAAHIAVQGTRGCAVREDKTVRCWGDLVGTVPGLTGVTQVALGGAHGCAILEDASVRCWGRNREGQLGDGTFDDRIVPVEVAGLGRATQLALGAAFSCARAVDATVRCWGDNKSHQIADGTTEPRATPILMSGLFEIFDITAGDRAACARMGNGDVRCWGALRIPGTDTDDLTVPTIIRW